MPTSPLVPGPWLERWLSAPRLQTYLGATNQDRSKALELYEWNTEMSAAVLQDLAHLEVAIRNAYNDALVSRQPGTLHWTQETRRYFPVMMKTAKNGRRYDRTSGRGSRSPMRSNRLAAERRPEK